MASSLSTTSPPPGPAFSWAGSKILQEKSLMRSFDNLGYCFCGFLCVCKTGHRQLESFLVLIGGFPHKKNICMDGVFFLPFLLESLWSQTTNEENKGETML